MRIDRSSIGAEAIFRHRKKRTIREYMRLPDSAHDRFNMRAIDKGFSGYYRYDEYNRKELEKIKEAVRRFNSAYNVQFHLFKHRDCLEVARIA